MTDLFLDRTPRLRPSPYLERALAAGAKGASVYNHMIIPSRFSGMLDEYHALINDVAIWDVACQRQVEIHGPQAGALVQYLCTRDISRMEVGQGRYTFLCNYQGGILNDPVVLRVGPDRFWLSLADRDILPWAQAIAAEGGWDAQVCEPDVSPLQIQGPKSGALVAKVFGPDIASLGYYRLAWTELEGISLLVSHSGWSGELGFEVFLTQHSAGGWLWDKLFAAGADLGVKPGSPNQIRRIEGGILSYGTDMDDTVTPFELGFGRLVNFSAPQDFVGRQALQHFAQQEPARRLTGARIDGPPILGIPEVRPVQWKDRPAGWLKSACFSPRFDTNLGFVFVESPAATPGTRLITEIAGVQRTAVTEPLPFVSPIRG